MWVQGLGPAAVARGKGVRTAGWRGTALELDPPSGVPALAAGSRGQLPPRAKDREFRHVDLLPPGSSHAAAINTQQRLWLAAPAAPATAAPPLPAGGGDGAGQLEWASRKTMLLGLAEGAPDETVILLHTPCAPVVGVSMGYTGVGVIKMTVSSMAAGGRMLGRAWPGVRGRRRRRAAGGRRRARRPPVRWPGTPTWTIFQQDGPNHLGLWCNMEYIQTRWPKPPTPRHHAAVATRQLTSHISAVRATQGVHRPARGGGGAAVAPVLGRAARLRPEAHRTAAGRALVSRATPGGVAVRFAVVHICPLHSGPRFLAQCCAGPPKVVHICPLRG